MSKWLAVVATIAFALQVSTISNRPTGYLHSWNQITTLSAVRHLSTDLSAWNTPQEVTTRLDWRLDPTTIIKAADQNFIVFEEFPLYHLLVAVGANTSTSLEVSARFISILFFLFGAVSYFKLVQDDTSPHLACTTAILYCSCFPLLYYGQAVMSDIAMLACSIAFVQQLSSYRRSKNKYFLISSTLLLILASLFKSYAIVLALLFPFAFFYRTPGKEKKTTHLLTTLLCSMLSLTPVLLWHWYCWRQSGHQEVGSHSIEQKLSVLTSLELYTTLGKMFFRYLGYLPGALLLLHLFLSISKKWRSEFPAETTWWLLPWYLASLIYCIITVDKLIDHDYYFLLLTPVLLFSSASALLKFCDVLSAKKGRTYAVAFFSLAIISTMAVSAAKYRKSTRENFDVRDCANLVEKHVKAEEILATLTDVSRYNSIAYYSNRYAINVEGESFPIERYSAAGASYLVVNQTAEQFKNTEAWIESQGNQPKLIAKDASLLDFKERPRTCALYRL